VITVPSLPKHPVQGAAVRGTSGLVHEYEFSARRALPGQGYLLTGVCM